MKNPGACFAVLLTLWSPPVAAATQAETCAVPDDALGTIAPLPRVAAVLKPGGRLRVLAVGSATMFGPESTLQPGTVTSQALNSGTTPRVPDPSPTPPVPTQAAFPVQMARTLQSAIPGLQVDVSFRGGRGMPSSEMLSEIGRALSPDAYQLVLWQTGTVEAVRNSPPGEFAQILSEGVEKIEAAGANLVLIDPQYSRFLQTNSNIDPYIQALQQAATMPGVVLFRRYDVMRAWVGEGRLDLERVPKADRKRTVEMLHHCLGTLLGRLILAGAKAS